MYQSIRGCLTESRFRLVHAEPMFQLRYRVFHERLKWEVDCRQGQEIDCFDDSASVYLLISQNISRIVGSWRLRPTTTQYMLADIPAFLPLLAGQPAPREENVWEISRFAVDQSALTGNRFGFNRVARQLIFDTTAFAVAHGITRYVMVVSVAVERLLKNMGLRLHRYSSPLRIGSVRTVACWIDIDAHTRNVVLGEPAAAELMEAA